MKFIKTPVKGMCDIMPEDMELREHVLSMIKETYKTYGFSQIETPVLEHIENLTGKQGGDNEKLIFKVMKRGAELQRALEKGMDDLADSGLRYDLTVPLARYYSGHASELSSPFKALQIGNVYRADKPQKGRFRQFTQCDIDILGDSTILAEIELIAATACMLTKIFKESSISKFTVHINDRKILKAMASYAGFSETDFDFVLISLDKMDKIGLDGVKKELIENGYPSETVEKYILLYSNITEGISCSEFCKLIPSEYLEAAVATELDTIIDCTRTMISPDVKLAFNPTLVRGMAYYTGTIFEISMDGYNFAIAGGGRYDEMIGKFCNNKTPACGFSIGFERILTIIKEHEKEKAGSKVDKIAFLVNKNADTELMLAVFRKATQLRENGKIVTVQPLNKNAKFQVESLEKEGYLEVKKVFCVSDLA